MKMPQEDQNSEKDGTVLREIKQIKEMWSNQVRYIDITCWQVYKCRIIYI